MASPADVSSDLSVPFSLLAGTVRNATEAATLAHLDLLAIQAEAIDEHGAIRLGAYVRGRGREGSRVKAGAARRGGRQRRPRAAARRG